MSILLRLQLEPPSGREKLAPSPRLRQDLASNSTAYVCKLYIAWRDEYPSGLCWGMPCPAGLPLSRGTNAPVLLLAGT